MHYQLYVLNYQPQGDNIGIKLILIKCTLKAELERLDVLVTVYSSDANEILPEINWTISLIWGGRLLCLK